MMNPNAIGDRIAASAEPVFIIPAAVPENFPAMSIGIDHIGPITSSAKKNAAPSDRMIKTRSWVRKTGNRQTNEPRNPIITTFRRAF